MYKLLPNDTLTGLERKIVLRKIDGVFIPFEELNLDYQKYLGWVAEGNTPEPADTQE